MKTNIGSTGSTSRTEKALLAVALVCGSWATPAWAGDVWGQATDPQGRPVIGAEVRLYDANGAVRVSGRSDGDGAYRFDDVSPGTYWIEAEGARSALRSGVEIRVGYEDLEHDLKLKLSALRTRVQVTASASPATFEETAKALDAVDGQEIALRDEFGLVEAIRNVPGVRVKQLRGPGGSTSIRVRGLRSQDTSLLIDGLRFRDAAATQGDASAFYQDVLIVDADRVEFLRGSGSSLYGSHAMGGVINLASRRGGGRPRGELLVEGGGLGLVRSAARIGGGLAEDRLIYSGGLTHLNVTQGIDPFDPYRNTSGQGFAKYFLTPKISLSGRVLASDAFAALNESPTFSEAVLSNHSAGGVTKAVGLPADQRERFERGESFDAGRSTFIPSYNDPDNHRASSYLAGALTLEHRLSPAGSYRVSYQGVNTGRSFRDGPGGVGRFDPVFSDESLFDGRIDTLQARADYRAGVSALTVGYEFEREEFVNQTTSQNPDPALRGDSRLSIMQASHSLFAQEQLRLADGRLQLGASGRIQTFDLDTPTASGGFNAYQGVALNSPPRSYTADGSIAYFFREAGTKLRAHVGNSFRAPSSFERFGGSFSSFSGGFDFWGDPRLSPERSIAVDAGVDQWLLDAKVQLSGTFFYTGLQETVVFDFGVIDASTDPFGRFGGYRNTGGGIARGAEFSVRAAPARRTNLFASYTYTNSDSRTPTIGADYFKAQGLSDHMFTMTATQWVTSRFNLTFDVFAASEYSRRLFGSSSRLVFDGPVKADLVASYAFDVGEAKQIKLYGKVENVLDRRYFEDGFEAPGAWGVVGLRFEF